MRLQKVFILLIAFFSFAFSAEVVDDFENGLNGWSGEGIYTTYYADPVNSNVMRMDTAEVWVEKTYYLGPLNANTEVTVNFDLWGIGGWESRGNAIDYISVNVNNAPILDKVTIEGAKGDEEAYHQHFTISVTTDEFGRLKLGFEYNVSAPLDEDLIVDDINITTPYDIIVSAVAMDDNYTTTTDNPLTDNLLSNDLGVDIYIESYTEPSYGTLTIAPDGNFTYTPGAGFIGTDTFTYTIIDQNGVTDSATVTITVDPKITEGAQIPFYLVNPPSSRNIVGNYKLAGNTVLCLTELTDGYGGTCHGDDDYLDITSNMNVTKYLDIDSDSGTWNSTSSYIELPEDYDSSRGVLWAGLFWQGRISVDKDHPIHYAVEDGETFRYVEVGEGTTISIDDFDIKTTGAMDLKLKINDSLYNDVTASHFHIYESGNGQTYAAYADVTSLFLTNPLSVGKNLFTVANLTTMEGREPSPGAFGGWALVVIYAEDYKTGKPRNISIYNGFVSISTDNDPIEISGFKLPETGDINAHLSVFSGEGEYLYGRNPDSNTEDWMKISDNETDGYDYLPGLVAGTDPGNRDNMFDARLHNILRDDIEVDGPDGYDNNLTTNNVGVDVDFYDVSDLMTQYRDIDPNVNSIYLLTYSNNDYITPSMIAFSSELYVPNICYDYTFDIDGYVLDSAENDINTSLHLAAPDKPLRTHLLIKSLEGDFILNDAELTVSVADPRQLQFIPGSSAIATYNINEYEPSSDMEHNLNESGFSLYFGVDATPDKGGSLDSYQSHYILFDYETNSSWPKLETAFKFDVNFTVDYGSGPVAIYKHLDANSRCPTSTLYAPEWGIFNIISDATEPNEYGLVTQVSNRTFNVHGVFYDSDFTTPKPITTDLEVELINANFFKSDTNASCYNPDSNISIPIFTSFNNSSTTAAIPNNPDYAMRNSAFRVWYLEDNESKLVTSTCGSRTNEVCFKALYDDKFAAFDSLCTQACDGTQEPGSCYSCLRKFYGKPLCSRDNFSIRPETFRIVLSDQNNGDEASYAVDFFSNTTTAAASVAADYNYSIRLTATQYGTDTAARKYIQAYRNAFPAGLIDENSTNVGIVSQFPAGYVCNNIENRSYGTIFWDGSAKTILTHNDVGDYRLLVRDSEWTKVDNPGRWGQDCINYPDTGYKDIPSEGKVGCIISSDYDSSHTDILLSFKPYMFDIESIELSAPNSTFIYMNTLTDDYNMSIRIKGPVIAKGKNGTVLSNFSNQCYAKDINLTFTRSLSPQESTLSAPSLLRYYDVNTTDTNTTDINDVDKIVSSRFTSGTSSADLAINIDRTTGRAVNPIELNITEIRVGCSNLSDCETFADQVSDHNAEGNLTLSAAPFRRFVYYGRLHAPDYRTEKDTINTPIYAEVYCDPIEVNCSNFNITRTNGWKESVDDVNWWINPLHTAADGNITELSATVNFAVNDSGVLINGANPYNAFSHAPAGGSYAPSVLYLGLKKPHRTRVVVSTEPWLQYHRFFSDGRVYYDITFEGAASDWAGIGQAGKSVDTNASGSSSRRIEW